MRRTLVPAALVAVLLPAAVAVAAPGQPSSPAVVADPAGYVDPLIGTGGDGFTVPGPSLPFGMTQVSPDETDPVAYTGYKYEDPTVRGFSFVHVDAAGVPIAGELPFLPLLAAPTDPSQPTGFAQTFSHAAEHVTAGAYDVTLDNGVTVDLAVTPHGGLQRYTPPAGRGFTLLADVGRDNAGVNDSTVAVTSATSLTGSTTVTWRGGTFTVHFAARFSRAFDSASTFVGSTVSDAQQASGTGAGALLTFGAGDPVTMAVGVSYVDTAGAARNLAAELPDFDIAKVQQAARDAWSGQLSKVRVGGGADADYRTFYTALYHALLHPDVDSDVDGRYVGPDGQVHQAEPGHPHYEDFSLWDTIRGENALLATLVPDRYHDMVASLSAYADRDGGVLPRWSLHSAHPDYMNGDPAIPTIADAVCRGLADDTEAGHWYAQARHLAFDLRSPDDLRLGYDPGSAANTLEYADADFALALMADRLGHPDDAATLRERALAWRNLYHDGFLQPRGADGSWPASYDPTSSTGYREGTGWQYLWLAPHDEGGLQAAYDRDGYGYASRLDHFFSVPASTAVPGDPVVPQVQSGITAFGTNYYGDQYVPGNEHDLEAPYLYDWTDRPSTTQAVLSSERSLFDDTPYGLPGNDDLGALSAWYVWAALGFYPIMPGAPVYVVGSPLFPHAEVDLTPGQAAPFVVDAPGASAQTPYVQSAALNGKPLDRSWFTADALRPGGSLTMPLGARASTWASGPTDHPPSLSTTTFLSTFACSGATSS